MEKLLAALAPLEVLLRLDVEPDARVAALADVLVLEGMEHAASVPDAKAAAHDAAPGVGLASRPREVDEVLIQQRVGRRVQIRGFGTPSTTFDLPASTAGSGGVTQEALRGRFAEDREDAWTGSPRMSKLRARGFLPPKLEPACGADKDSRERPSIDGDSRPGGETILTPSTDSIDASSPALSSLDASLVTTRRCREDSGASASSTALSALRRPAARARREGVASRRRRLLGDGGEEDVHCNRGAVVLWMPPEGSSLLAPRNARCQQHSGAARIHCRRLGITHKRPRDAVRRPGQLQRVVLRRTSSPKILGLDGPVGLQISRPRLTNGIWREVQLDLGLPPRRFSSRVSLLRKRSQRRLLVSMLTYNASTNLAIPDRVGTGSRQNQR